MLSLLAQVQPPTQGPLENLFETVTTVFSRGDTLAHPGALIESLQAMSVVWAIVFLIVGVLCMLSGYKFYRAVTVLLALAVGMFAGYYLGKKINAEYIVAGCLGLLFAVCCFPLLKYAVAALGGLAGAFLGANLWSSIAHLLGTAGTATAKHYWVGALIGLILCGMLAFILWKLSIVLFTSVGGATIAVLGGMALVLNFQPWRQTVTDSLSAHAITIPLLVFIPALIALIFQEAQHDDTDGKPADA
ncbi:MAG: hypothetical protein V3U29_01525 [Phycisphaeraceae bacterium]